MSFILNMDSNQILKFADRKIKTINFLNDLEPVRVCSDAHICHSIYDLICFVTGDIELEGEGDFFNCESFNQLFRNEENQNLFLIHDVDNQWRLEYGEEDDNPVGFGIWLEGCVEAQFVDLTKVNYDAFKAALNHQSSYNIGFAFFKFKNKNYMFIVYDFE